MLLPGEGSCILPVVMRSNVSSADVVDQPGSSARVVMRDTPAPGNLQLPNTAPVTGAVAPRARLDRWGGYFSFVRLLVLAAFLMRIIAALILHQIVLGSGRGSFFTRGDEAAYDFVAWQLAQVWSGQLAAVHPSYTYLINAYTQTGGVIYLLVGHRAGAMIALNCLFGALAAGVVYLATRRLFGELAARFAGIGMAFFPSLFFWSLFNMKDAMFVLALAVLIWAMTALLQTGKLWWLPVVFASVFVLGSLRFYVQGLLTVLLPVAVLLQRRAVFPRRWRTATLVLVGCGALLLFSGSGVWLANQLTTLTHIRYATAGDANSAFVPTPVVATTTAAPGAAQVPPPVDSEATTRRGALRDLLHWLPIGLAYTLAAPFPWAVRRTVELMAMPEVFCWYGALALGALGVFVRRQEWRRYLYLAAYIGALLLVMAIAESTTGTLLRHRTMVIPSLLVLSGAGASWLWQRLRGRSAIQVAES